MNALNFKAVAKVAKEVLMLAIELVGLWSCTTPVDPPSSSVAREEASPAVTMSTSAPIVHEGEVLWLRLDLTNPCREAHGAMGMTVSWDTDRFEYTSTPEDVADHQVELAGAGLARIRVNDLAGLHGEIDLSFRALVAGSADGFVVEDVTLACGDSRGGGEPPVLARW